MRPYKYTVKGSKTTFHYKFTELRLFIERGKSFGDVGMLLTGFDNKQNFIYYNGFGTIENPRKSRYGFVFKHNPIFDSAGHAFDADLVINPKPDAFPLSNHRMIFID